MHMTTRALAVWVCAVVVAARRVDPAPAALVLHEKREEVFPPAVIGYVSFGKVGSSLLRKLMEARAKALGWEHYRREEDREICHSYNTEGTPDCADVPDGYVVQTQYGFCEALHNTTGRECRYFTILREPVERLVSAWNYFCRACAEGGSFCVDDQKERDKKKAEGKALPRDDHGIPIGDVPNSCPDMDVVSFAVHKGNNYVRQFSGLYTGRLGHSSTGLGDRDLNETHLAAATGALRRQDMLVLFTDELSDEGLKALGSQLDYDLQAELRTLDGDDGHINEFDGTTKLPTAAEMEKLQHFFRWDAELYATTHESLRLRSGGLNGLAGP